MKIQLQGAFQQPQLHMSEHLVTRVGRPNEAYLIHAARRNFTEAGKIGAIQANASFTKNFLFDPNISKCDFYEDVLRCDTAVDPLVSLRENKEYLLPSQKDFHLFRMQDDKLVSSLLTTSAVRLQLYFREYKISVKAVNVCPLIEGTTFNVKGCYKCNFFARVTFRTLSTCQRGLALIEFQEISVHTKAITLDIKSNLFEVKILAEKKCYKEKICLRAQTIVQCEELAFCLDEPSIDLLNLDTNYTVVHSSTTAHSYFDWLRLPTVDASYVLLKIIGSGLFIICLSITLFSTCITCCCRSR